MSRRLALALSLLCCAAMPLRAQNAPAPDSGIVSGTVVSTAGTPLGQAEVTLSTTGEDSRLAAQTVTAEDGAFRFTKVPAGKYALRASHRGYLTSAYQQHEGFFTAIVTGPGLDTQNLRLQLTPWAVIDGAVTDDSGEPVPGAQVTLWTERPENPEMRFVRAHQQMTDATGTYEFAQLRPGTYYLSVQATPWYAFRPPAGQGGSDGAQPASPLDVAYPLTFFENATDSGSATPIDVHAADRLQLNIAMHAVPAAHLRIQIPAPDPHHGFAIPQIAEEAFGTSQYLGGSAVTRIISSGTGTGQMTIDLGGIAPGQYVLRQFGPDRGESRQTTVDVASGQPIELAAPAPGGVSLTGQLAMAFGGALPGEIRVNLSQDGGDMPAPMVAVSPGGAFTFDSLAPGKYRLHVMGSGSALSVLQMAASGAVVQGDEFTVGTDSVLLAATIADGQTTVTGFTRRNGAGTGGAMVVLVPSAPGAPAELFRRDQSDSDGSFTLQRVVPGAYTVIAVEDGWTLAWTRPEVMARYLAQGVRIQIPPNATSFTVPGPVPVQDR